MQHRRGKWPPSKVPREQMVFIKRYSYVARADTRDSTCVFGQINPPEIISSDGVKYRISGIKRDLSSVWSHGVAFPPNLTYGRKFVYFRESRQDFAGEACEFSTIEKFRLSLKCDTLGFIVEKGFVIFI